MDFLIWSFILTFNPLPYLESTLFFYLLLLQAKTTDTAGSETSGLSAETEILIIIVDVNDHEPMFVPLNYTQIKCENHGGDTVIPHFLITVTVSAVWWTKCL